MCVCVFTLGFFTTLIGPKAPSAGEGGCVDDNQHCPVSRSNAGHGCLLLDWRTCAC